MDCEFLEKRAVAHHTIERPILRIGRTHSKAPAVYNIKMPASGFLIYIAPVELYWKVVVHTDPDAKYVIIQLLLSAQTLKVERSTERCAAF